ncbi:hypothetical protein RRF57_001629 [Xylaria bambusicola]|uniref:Uncharacterized protein n=1 Tax=Xylaria bambusicola TaxID=326684 RepID=A0AAN7Z3R2_9PEZI
MAPSTKAQPKPAKSASGHTKKQHPAPVPTVAAPAHRQHVVPAIPLTLMNKHPDSARNTAAKPSPKHAPVVATSNGFPASSLEAALISRDPLHSAKNSENEVKRQNEEKFTPPGVAPPGEEDGNEQHSQLTTSRVNGVDYTTMESAPADRLASG